MRWKRLSSKYLLKNKWLAVRRDSLKMPSGKVKNDFFTVERTDFAVVLALTAKQEVVMVKQFRYSINKTLLELPAGHFEKDESPARAARRELLEETGYRVKTLKHLGTFYTAPGLLREKCYAYIGAGARKTGKTHFDPHEDIKVSLVPLKKAILMAKTGKIQDVDSVIALLLFAGLSSASDGRAKSNSGGK